MSDPNQMKLSGEKVGEPYKVIITVQHKSESNKEHAIKRSHANKTTTHYKVYTDGGIWEALDKARDLFEEEPEGCELTVKVREG